MQRKKEWWVLGLSKPPLLASICFVKEMKMAGCHCNFWGLIGNGHFVLCFYWRFALLYNLHTFWLEHDFGLINSTMIIQIQTQIYKAVDTVKILEVLFLDTLAMICDCTNFSLGKCFLFFLDAFFCWLTLLIVLFLKRHVHLC